MEYTGNRKFQLTESQLIHLFIEKCRQFGSTKTGTYNVADPTHFEKIAVTFIDPYLEEPEEEEWPDWDEEELENDNQKVQINIVDCTWNIKISFSKKDKEIAKGMWDPDTQKFINVMEDQTFFDNLINTICTYKHESEITDSDFYDCLSSYE